MTRDFFLNLANILLTALAPLVVAYIHRWLGIQANSRAAAVVNLAVERGAGMLYSALARGIVEISDSKSIQHFTQSYAGQVFDRVAESAARLGVTQAQIEEMIQGELGKLLASDPNISVPVKAVG